MPIDPGVSAALCHEWLTTYGGSEQVAGAIARGLGIDDIYSFVVNPKLATEIFPGKRVHETKLGSASLAQRRWQWFLPFIPRAWRGFHLEEYDLIITSSHSCTNSIRKGPRTTLICYCHTPMRYAWDWRSEVDRFPFFVRAAWPAAAGAFRRADRRWSQKVDLFVANSKNVSDRIRNYYGRESVVIYPPVDTNYWSVDPSVPKEDFFLLAGRLVSYKRGQLAVAAANLSRSPLTVAGSGPELERLQRMAGPTVHFVNQPDRDALRDLYRRASALVFPGIEDFGMTMVEAQACGTPVIAFGAGGALEAVAADGGTFFNDANPRTLADVLTMHESRSFVPETVRRGVLKFDSSVFDRCMDHVVREVLRGAETDDIRESLAKLADGASRNSAAQTQNARV